MTKTPRRDPGKAVQCGENSIGATIPPELKAALGQLRVQAEPCRTCIYHKDTLLHIDALEERVRDPFMGFKGYRICHHSDDACCRGFWNRHKDEFPAGQIAQRLDLVAYVNDDNWIKGEDDQA